MSCVMPTHRPCRSRRPCSSSCRSAAIKIQSRLTEGDTGPLEESAAAPATTFRSYVERWVETHVNQVCKFSTARVYSTNLKRHILPVLGDRPVTAISRLDCRTLIVECRSKGLSRQSIQNIGRTVSSVLSQACSWPRRGRTSLETMRPFSAPSGQGCDSES